MQTIDLSTRSTRRLAKALHDIELWEAVRIDLPRNSMLSTSLIEDLACRAPRLQHLSCGSLQTTCKTTGKLNALTTLQLWNGNLSANASASPAMLYRQLQDVAPNLQKLFVRNKNPVIKRIDLLPMMRIPSSLQVLHVSNVYVDDDLYADWIESARRAGFLRLRRIAIEYPNNAN